MPNDCARRLGLFMHVQGLLREEKKLILMKEHISSLWKEKEEKDLS
jgi:hypothetical protein